MSRDYSEGGYYQYGQPQYYYNAPGMYRGNYNMPHGHYHGQQYMNTGFQDYQNQQYYNDYQGQGYMSYDYSGYGQGYDMDQNQTNFDGAQSEAKGTQNRTQTSRSKHSYSQNRNRNRQRPDPHAQVAQTPAVTNVSNDSNNATSTNTADYSSDTKADQNIQDSSSYSSINDKDQSQSTPAYDRGRNRGGRFQGNDTRSRPFDRSQQLNDRQRKYNKQPPSNTTSDSYNSMNKENTSYNDTNTNTASQNTNNNANNYPSARPKSYRDNRGGTGFSRNRGNYNDTQGYRGRDYRNKEENRSSNQPDRNMDNQDRNTHSQRPKTPTDDFKVEVVDNPDSSDSGKDKYGGRRKKKEIKVFSSSSHRDWQSKSTTFSQREANERYNYRGQDYNKRHKEVTNTGMERGSDRTKLSSFNEKKDKDEGEVNEDDDISSVKENTRPKRSDKYGPNRASRHKPKGKVDESQRGVLIEQLTRGSYECMVCCETVRAQNAIWGCTSCYHVFHLRCVKKWARSPNAVVSGTDKDGWRCPACQNLSFKFPNQYRCFCGKMRDPEVSRLETPHSCGDVCQKERGEGCKHPCNILCHPGPCPECNAIVTKSCDCGKTKQTVKCGQSSVIKCESECERQLNCGKHFCKAKCHAGPCEKCEEVIIQECLGKHETREVVCGSELSFQETYSCATICSKLLDCGNHNCDKPCHQGDCDSCPLLPGNITHCPCGVQRLDELTVETRTSCLDPIPTCQGVCNKTLQCGPENKKHLCEQTCHEGPCGPCNGTTMLTCRCLFMDKEFNCSQIQDVVDENGRFLCDRRCNRKKTCGRHKCGERCCIKEEHLCDALCGRKLPCGLHKCEEPCHRNNCPPCLMASFDELTCYCGAEVMYPPIPCGTKPPECHRPCTRQHTCDHPVRHNCHSEDTCPPCTELTQKMCMGNHVKRANIPCHIKDISCGMKCSRRLSCGLHSCIRICHKGDCIEEGQTCQQPCPKKRELCGHPCGTPCHGDEPCPPIICKAKVKVKCACGHREAEMLCSAGLAADNMEYTKISMQNLKDSLQGIISVSSVNVDTLKQGQQRLLECTKECALIERNRRVAEALDIQNPDLLPKFGTSNYTEFLKDFTKQNPQFVAGVEKEFSDLVLSANKSKQPSRSHAFPCMNSNHRRLIHELAESYGIETQSYDYEPKKNVVATAKKDKSWVPSVTLTSLIHRENHPRAPPPIPHVHREEALRQSNQAVKQSTSLSGDTGSTLAEGWQVIGKKTKKTSTNSSSKSAIGTIDKFEGNLDNICATGKVDYNALSKESKEALKAEPVVDYFDFTVT